MGIRRENAVSVEPSAFAAECPEILRAEVLYDRLAPLYDRAGLARLTLDVLRPHLLEVLATDAPPQGPWIDLGCGTGQLLAQGLPNLGPHLGLDLSTGMLIEARSRTDQVLRGDLGVLPFMDRRVSLVTAFFDVVNHLRSTTALLSCFREVRRVLVADGLFVFDLSGTSHLRLWDGAVDDIPLAEGRLSRRGRFDAQRGVVSAEFVLIDDQGSNESLGTLRERAFPEGAVQSLLGRAGFDRIERTPVRKSRGQTLRTLWSSRRPRSIPGD